MKKIFPIFMITIILFSTMIFPVSANNDEISVYLDGIKISFDVPPQIINGRTMVPIRAIFEKMGAVVEWDTNTNTAICNKDGTIVKMTVDSKNMYINNNLIKLDTPPVVINGRTLAPARYVAEAFGANVQWSQKNNSVVICSENIYAYADYPDIPDLGKCYDIQPTSDEFQQLGKVYTYNNVKVPNENEGNGIYKYSLLVLGNYTEEILEETSMQRTVGYTKQGETISKFYVSSGYYDGEMFFSVLIPITTLYAMDGRTIEVFGSEVPAYLNVGWYETIEETQQTMYAPDGRTITIFKSEVPAYKNVGWYETQSEAFATNNSSAPYNPSPDGNFYRTPTGERYHLDPNCGGKNSYKTSNIWGLSPCAKCAM